jgi:hypothetical protein
MEEKVDEVTKMKMNKVKSSRALALDDAFTRMQEQASTQLGGSTPCC